MTILFAYQASKYCILTESTQEQGLNFSAVMIVGCETLQDFVKTLARESPEAVDGSKVVNLLKNVSNPMVIGFHVESMHL